LAQDRLKGQKAQVDSVNKAHRSEISTSSLRSEFRAATCCRILESLLQIQAETNETHSAIIAANLSTLTTESKTFIKAAMDNRRAGMGKI
jgi:hypothetical protein